MLPFIRHLLKYADCFGEVYREQTSILRIVEVKMSYLALTLMNLNLTFVAKNASEASSRYAIRPSPRDNFIPELRHFASTPFVRTVQSHAIE